MWKLLRVILILHFNDLLHGKLVGDHICLTEESYLTNVTEHHIRNATVRNYQWCMNMPPRCSFYTTKTINETKIVEKNLTRTVEKCCEGFLEEDEKCISECRECKNGLCQKGTCLCSAGYSGHSCDVACEPGKWGRNCSFECSCVDKKCNPKNGLCLPEQTSTTTFAVTLTSTSSTTIRSITTSQLLGTETVPNTPSTSTRVSVVENTTTHSTPTVNITEKVLATTSPPQPTQISNKTDSHLDVANTSPPINLRQDFLSRTNLVTTSTINTSTSRSSSLYNATSTLLTITTSENGSTIPEHSIYNNIYFKTTVNTNDNDIIHRTTDNIMFATEEPKKIHTSLNDYKEYLIPVEVQYDQITRPIIKKDALTTTPNNFAEEKSYLTVYDKEYIDKHISEEKNKLVINFSIAGTTILVIAVIVVSLLGISLLWRSKNKKKNLKHSNETTPAVSVYTTSIFHTPLPDPPTFENLTYLTPTDLGVKLNEQISFKSHVVNPKNTELAKKKKEYREYVYDHPPSTGSYRAASSIEAIESNLNHRLAEIEPVYDEIPQRFLDVAETSFCHECRDQPSSLYVNTCGRTKF